jgi:hypothetical protein
LCGQLPYFWAFRQSVAHRADTQLRVFGAHASSFL